MGGMSRAPTPTPTPTELAGPRSLTDRVLEWYQARARDLPWRRPEATPWAVLVSEVMLQQTPVARVVPAYQAWLHRWPRPVDLAVAEPGDAVRQWGRLGYPRRALRLHTTARLLVADRAGRVPDDLDALLALPGLGAYTARAVAAFAFGQRHPVVDTNVARVWARVLDGAPTAAAVGARELRRVEPLLPTDGPTAARFGVAVMELGALVCTARAPRCPACPLRPDCAWDRSGRPGGVAPAGRRPGYAGTDREVRGRLLAVLRSSEHPVPATQLTAVWADAGQRDRALATLLADGLAVRDELGGLRLP